MEIDDYTKKLAEEVGAAINESVQQSSRVAEALERLREAGFEMDLTLRLEMALRPHVEEGEGADPESLELTDEDVRVLRAMKIMIDTDKQ